MPSLRMASCSCCGRAFLPVYHGSLCSDCVETGEESHPRAVAYERGWHDGYHVGFRKAGQVASWRKPEPSARDLLPIDDLIRLCHPDRHPAERSAAATRVTQILLSVRDAEHG